MTRICDFVRKEELEQVMALWDYCFEKKGDPFYEFYFKEYCFKKNKVYGLWQEEAEGRRLLSMVHLNNYLEENRTVELMVPCLVGVATQPEHRGQHLLKPLFEGCFRMLYKQRLPYVQLMPIYAGIYQPYNFVFTHFAHEYKMPLEVLKGIKHQKGYICREVELEATLMAKVYDAFVDASMDPRTIRSTVKRRPQDWQKLISDWKAEGVKCIVAEYIAEADWAKLKGLGGAEEASQRELAEEYSKLDVYSLKVEPRCLAYMLYKIEEDSFTVVELAYAYAQARNELLSYTAALGETLKEFHWFAPEDDNLYFSFANQEHSGQYRPLMMSRIINVRAALEVYLEAFTSNTKLKNACSEFMGKVKALLGSKEYLIKSRGETKEQLSIEIKDPLIEQNNRIYSLVFSENEIKLKVSKNGRADFSFTIEEFTQLYLGVFDENRLKECLLDNQRDWVSYSNGLLLEKLDKRKPRTVYRMNRMMLNYHMLQILFFPQKRWMNEWF